MKKVTVPARILDLESFRVEVCALLGEVQLESEVGTARLTPDQAETVAVALRDPAFVKQIAQTFEDYAKKARRCPKNV